MKAEGMFLVAMLLSTSFVVGQDRASLANRHLAQGIADLESKQLENAERELRRVIELDPGNAQACNLLGSIHDSRGEYEQADAYFLAAIKSAPSFPASYNNLGISYLRQNRLDSALKEFTKALELDPRDATTHYNLGLVYMRGGDSERSISHLEQARSLRPGDTAIVFNLAKAYSQRGDYGIALPILESLDRDPASAHLAEVQTLLGTVLAQSGQPDPAIAHLKKAAELDPASSDPHYRLALAWQKKGNRDEAFHEIQEAIRLQARPVAAHYLVLGMIHRERGEPEQANQAFKRALEISPEDDSTRFTLAVLLRDAGRFPDAVRMFERIESARHVYEVDFNLAMTYYLAGDFPRALNLLEQVSSAGTREKPAGYYKLLADVYDKLDRWSEALATYERAIQFDPRNPDVYFDLGLTLVNVGAITEAEQLFLGVLKRFPDSAELYVGLAQARMAQDHYQEAVDALGRAIQINPNYSEAHYLMGNSFNETNQYSEARQAYQKAIGLSPERDDFHFSLATVLEKLGEEDAALAEFGTVINLNPASGNGHYRRGRLYSQRGDYGRALDDLGKAVELKPKDPQGFYQLATVYLKTGRRREAQQALEMAEKLKQKTSYAERSILASVKVKPVEEYLRQLSP